jgi:hypothetical protein
MLNTNIMKAVGRGGANLPADVRKIQELLNEHTAIPMRPLVPDGACGPATITAIEEFQRRVMRMAAPDGKVDPQGATMAALSPVALERAPEVLVPYREGHGLYVKRSGSDSLFGTPKTLASLETLARKVAEGLGANLGLVDLSYERGGVHPDHKSHRRGVDVDVRPLRTDKKNEGVTVSDPAYSLELTKTMVSYIWEDPNTALILFNDSRIARVTPATGHDNHLHIRFKE